MSNGQKFEQEVFVVPSQESQEQALIQLATNRIEKMVRLKELSLKVTNHFDWVDFGNKPYMTGGGAEKVGRLFGVKISNTAYKKERGSDEIGDYYFYVYTGLASLPGDVDQIECVGTCSSRDKFFAYNSKQEAWKPTSEVDETNIMKAAYTNMIQNGVTRLLGLRNLTWEELKQVANIDKVARVEFKGQKKEADESTGSTDEKEKNRVAIVEMLLEICGGDETAAKDKLKEITKWGKFQGINHSKEMLNWDSKRIFAVMGNVKKLYKETFGKEYEPAKVEDKNKAQDQGQGKRLAFVELLIKDIKSYSVSRKLDLSVAFDTFKKAYPDVKETSWEDLSDSNIEYFAKFIKQ